MSNETDVFAHRRGLMLGLTLAEVLMLVLFILLLTYSAILKSKEDELKQFERQNREQTEQIVKLQEEIELGITSLIEALSSPSFQIKNESELAVRLRSISSEISSLKRDNERYSNLIPSSEKAEFLAEELANSDSSVEEIIEEWLEASDSGDEDKTTLQPKTMEDAEKIIARLERQTDYLEKRLLEAGNGLTLPPCWSKSGRSEDDIIIVYTYDIRINDSDLTLVARDDRKGQDMSAFTQTPPEPPLGEPISYNKFLNGTRSLREWSDTARCRFYARIYDATSSDNKAGYKKGRRIVEQHFYINDMS